jgi:O-succinylbenzoate synthase
VTTVRAVELHLVGLPLVRPFRTSFGSTAEKVCILARVETEHAEGWGECVADREPDFGPEWNDGVWSCLTAFLIPALLRAGDVTSEDLGSLFSFVRGNRMAKATLIDAFLDAELRERDRSLAAYLGATVERVPCGVSLGITETVEELREQVDAHVAEGYRRIKLKIEPGTDVERVAAIRADHPNTPLSVDANAAYRSDDIAVFRELDDLGLLMIEQPLQFEDLVEHAALQRQIRTPICLDESIRSPADAAVAVELGACRIVNIKQGRVGGVLEARAVHDLCRDAGIPVWCGGMLETGIGRATNLALAAMPGFTLPGDTSASARYFPEDLTEPFTLEPDGTMVVPNGIGIGVTPRPDRLQACTIRRTMF